MTIHLAEDTKMEKAKMEANKVESYLQTPEKK